MNTTRTYFMFTPGSHGPHIRGPFTLAEVSSTLRELESDTGRATVLAAHMPDWEYAPESTIVVVRGEVTTDARLCACGSGESFGACHGAHEAPPPPGRVRCPICEAGPFSAGSGVMTCGAGHTFDTGAAR